MTNDTTPAPIGADALSAAAQVALAEYANPLNWEADENGIRRIWREPDSYTPDAYDGFKLARAALASAAQPQAATDYSACASADSNYAAGMLIGWNLCVAGDEASFGRIREDRMRAAIQASRAAKTTLAGAAQPAAVPPEGFVVVPVELAKRVQESLGEFLMDHGWSQRDMDTSDEFDAVLLASAPKAAPARWYMVNAVGMATLCAGKQDAEQTAADAQAAWPHAGPHRVVQMVEVTAAPTPAAQGDALPREDFA